MAHVQYMVEGESLVLGMSAQYHAGEQNIADIVLVIIPHQPMVGKIAQAVTPRLKNAMKIHAQSMVDGEIGQSGTNVL
jgi:phosphohistidine phosphatase SixA